MPKDPSSYVDVAFALQGGAVPRDHGYPLYSALCRNVPALHSAPWLAVHPLSGTRIDSELLMLPRRAQLRLRLPVEKLPVVLPLAGRRLDLGRHAIRVGTPTVQALVPAPSLDARLVVVKVTSVAHKPRRGGEKEALDTVALQARVASELHRQLTDLAVQGNIELTGRGRLSVNGRRVVGFSVRVSGLSPEHSLILQAFGLGGKRRMGCGLFRATRGR